MNVVIVESPAKAKTINKYLGTDYEVFASYGHVRDLPPKDGSVAPDDDFKMIWQVDGKAQKRLSEIAAAVKGADRLILATDPDREGEAISWHVLEVLKEKRALKDQKVDRVVFNAITKAAVQEAMAHPREIDHSLVDAYLARRALDYLVGFTLSPVLWRKLPGARSAGRVQSVALRLVCDREREIEAFKPQEYWSVAAVLATPRGDAFEARLVAADGKKISRLDVGSEKEARDFEAALNAANFKVASIEAKPAKRNPYPPFTTSTLQQEASRKLGFAPSHTMRLAQRLYEGIEIDGDTTGLITYMRTDGIDLAPEAIAEARAVISSDYGKNYLPDSPRIYKNKSKNAQEAHEAIRPTDLRRHPKEMARKLDADQSRLYELIWTRTLACQMESAELERTVVEIEANVASGAYKLVNLRATGTVVKFDGFLTLYNESRDDDFEDEDARRLPAINEGEQLKKNELKIDQHFTEPPPRFSEASLVKRMEELGIGRPSTYASILQVLRDRGYTRLDKKRIIPEDKGRIVVAFLESYFPRYVEYDFTADLEGKLDEIANHELDWKKVLREFWTGFTGAVAETKDLRIKEVIDVLDALLNEHNFPPKADGSDPRACPQCGTGRLGLKVGKFGAFRRLLELSGMPLHPRPHRARRRRTGGDQGTWRRSRDQEDDHRALGALRSIHSARRARRHRRENEKGRKAHNDEAEAREHSEEFRCARTRLRYRDQPALAPARSRQASRERRTDRRGLRALRSLREASGHLRQPYGWRRSADRRPQPRRHAHCRKDCTRSGSRTPQATRPCTWRTSVSRRSGDATRRQIRPLRVAQQGQRNDSRCYRSGDDHA
jgi:DNA topoisomerase-1